MADSESMSLQSKNLFQGTCLGILVGFAFMLIGYLLDRHHQVSFGYSMFLLVPFVAGFAVAATVRKPRRIISCCICGAALCLITLIFTGLEGYLCIIMASPLLASAMAIGAFLGYFIRGRIIDRMDGPGKKTTLLLLTFPFLIAASDRLEQPFIARPQRETFASEITIPVPPEQTWKLLAEMKPLHGPLPFLVAVGLPLPQSCTLDTQAVGGRRTCYFNTGLIRQEVNAWQPPVFMQFKITQNTLPGRHWLTFLDASYELFPAGSQTRLVRRTTIGTHLYPRWYWRPFERWGVLSEHDYVLVNIQKWARPN